MQSAAGITGDFLEIGVFLGFSQAMMALHRGKNEKLVSVDPSSAVADYLPTLQMADAEVSGAVELHRMSSFDPGLMQRLAPLTSNARSIHIDGEHSCEAVVNDMGITSSLLTTRGLLVVDDFFNSRCPPVTQATYDYLSANKHRLVMAFSGFNKAFCCHPRDYPFYLATLLNMVEALEACGMPITVAVSGYAASPGSLSVFTRDGDDGYQVVMKTLPTKRAMLEWLGFGAGPPHA